MAADSPPDRDPDLLEAALSNLKLLPRKTRRIRLNDKVLAQFRKENDPEIPHLTQGGSTMFRRIVVCLIASAGLVLAGTIPSTASASEYVRQSNKYFTILPGSCTGETWIGQTTSNSIQATVTVRCPGTVGFLRGWIYLRKNGNLTPVSSSEYYGVSSRFGTASTSAYGGPRGTRWCAHGVGGVGGVEVTKGYSIVCITI